MGAPRWVYLFANRQSTITSNSYRGSAGRRSPAISGFRRGCGFDPDLFGAALRKNRRDANSGAFSAFRVSEWSVRRKVVGVLAIPVVLAAVFGGLRVSSELQDASAYSTNQQRATVLGPTITYLTATARLALPAHLSDAFDGDAKAQYTEASNTLKRASGSADLTSVQAGYITSILQIGDTLATGGGTGISADTSVQLSDMTRLTTQLVNSTLNTEGTPDPQVQALIQSLNGRLSLVKQQLLIQSHTQQKSSLLDSVWLAAEIGVEGSALDSLKAAVGGRRINTLVSANGVRLGQATSSKVGALAATPRMFQVYDGLNDRLLAGIDSDLAAKASSSKSRALGDAGIILTALLASLLLGLFVARALIVPLRKVRAGALEVANERLPETVARIRNGQEPEEITPIPVHSREELGQLARAVDDMHKQAVNLATGEAQLRSQVGAMFVTLSRRNTTLVNQQLALIESLEQDEEDPQRLEQLFSLDHLATRMRRTAESLVILGGTSGRAAGFEELSVSDVVHAAVSEVQDYQRVRIDAAPDRMIVGRAASDVVHLMAELIDNALSYSPPGSPVTIQAAETDGKVEIEIIDNGLGMAGDALAQANESLKSGGEVTIDTARRMGLFVVSRLSEEHGLKVKLRRNTNGGGIIASITLPPAVLVSDAPVEHVSVIDAPEPAEEPVVPVFEEPVEEYDPYLERIEEAIAAVTGLPRRRPGQVPGPATPAPATTSVGMFDAAPLAAPTPELPPGFEPAELPSGEQSASEPEPVVTPFTSSVPPADDEPLAEVVTPVFGAERHELKAESDQPEALEVGEVHQDRDDHVEPEQSDLPEAPVAEVLHDRDDHVEPEQSDLPEAPVAEAEALDEVGEPTESIGYDETIAPHQPVEAVGWVDEAAPVEHDEPAPPSPWAASLAEAAGAYPEAPVAEPAAAATLPQETSYDVPEPVSARAEEKRQVDEGVPATDATVRLQIRRPLSSSPAASALEGDFVPDNEDRDDATIFSQLRSNWLSGAEEAEHPWVPNEVDRGWNAAERAEGGDDADSTTRTGLPVRRPGGRLVPGGVNQEPSKVVRDPEAIRNRLAAHAAGVSRGRAAAAAQPNTFDYPHEETGPA
jgi:signal transduction histidine kinase